MELETFLNVYGRDLIIMLSCNPWGATVLHKIASDKHEAENYW